jgi:hypothetical protein
MCAKFLRKVKLCVEAHVELNQALGLACQIYAKTQFLVLSIGYSYYYFIFFIFYNYNLYFIFIFASFGRNVSVSLQTT